MLARRSCTTIALSLGVPCREELVDGVCRSGARAVGNVCAELEAEAPEGAMSRPKPTFRKLTEEEVRDYLAL